MKLKLRPNFTRTFLLVFMATCSFFNSFGQCEKNGVYFVQYSYGIDSDLITMKTLVGPDEPKESIFDVRLEDISLRPSFRSSNYDFYAIETRVPPSGFGESVLNSSYLKTFDTEYVNYVNSVEMAISLMYNYLYNSARSYQNGIPNTGQCYEGYIQRNRGFCEGETDNLWRGRVYSGPDPTSESNPPYILNEWGDTVSLSDFFVKEVKFYDRMTGTFETVYTKEGGSFEVNCCPVSSLSIEPTSYLEKTDPDSGNTVRDIWNASDAFDFTKAFELKNQDDNSLAEEDKVKVRWHVYDNTDTENPWQYVDPSASENSITEYYFDNERNIDEFGKVKIKAEYTCDDGSITSSDTFEMRIACLSRLIISPTTYLEKIDPDTGTNVSNAWNADDAFDFTKAFELKDQDGNLLSEEDLEKVKWYVEDRSKLDDKFIYVNPEDSYNTPKEYYFNGKKNVDQWGEVLIRAEYECGNGTIVRRTTELEILDIGMYFRDPGGNILRWHKNLYEKDPSIYDGFYNPSKNIVMHSHGWQPGENAKHKLNPSGNPVRDRLGEDGIDEWHNDYNVLLFFWTQSADHINGYTPAFINFIEPSKRAFKRNPKWIRENGTESLVATSFKSIGLICGEQVKEIITTTGFNNEAREVRLVGHSFGALVVTRATQFLGTSIVDRMVYLDPATTSPFLEYYQDKIMPDPSIMPPTEWYQSSAYDLVWKPSSFFISGFGDRGVYNTLISNTTYVRIHPLWEASYPVGDGILHGSAKEHYYKSLNDLKPQIVNSTEPTFPSGISTLECAEGSVPPENRSDIFFDGLPFYSNPLYMKCFETTGPRIGPSAAASLEELAFYKGKALEQVYGKNTVSVGDDRYALRNPDSDGNHIGQEYNEVDLSLEAVNGVNDIVLSWGNNNEIQARSLSKSQSTTPSYYVILDQDLKGIGFTSENSYTVEGLTPNTSYEFFVLPIGSDGYPTGYDTVEAATYDPQPIALGIINNFQDNKRTWHEVTFSSPMYNPSVVFGPASYNDEEPVTIRIKDVTNFGFKYQFDEWDYQDGSHTNETISYLAISEGVTRFGGLTIESAIVADVNHTIKSVDFKNEFTTKPIVFTQVSSFKGGSAVVTRVKNISTTGFDLKVQEEQGNDNKHARELVSYIAIEPGTYRYSNGLTLIVGSDTFNHNFKSLNFSGIENPVFIASMQTTNGGDPTGLRYRDLNTSSVQLKLEEEQSKDTEVWHVNEEVGYFIYGIEATENASRASKIANTDAPFKLFPNPTTGKIFLNSEVDIKKATVLDIHGRVLLNIDITNKNQEIDVSGLKTGMYMLQIITNQNEQRSLTFIKS